MDTTIEARVFEWRGVLSIVIDRVDRSGHRRLAHHHRLASYSLHFDAALNEDQALSWAIACLTDWERAGCPRGGRVAAPAPLDRGHGVDRATGAPPQVKRSTALPSQTEPPPVEHRDGEAVSDGLYPPGVQLPLDIAFGVRLYEPNPLD